MKKYSVNVENVFRDEQARNDLAESPKAFRHIHAAVAFVMEAALTGKMPEAMVPVAGPAGAIDIQPDRIFLVASRVNRVRCYFETGNLGPIVIRACIDFIDEGGNVSLSVTAAADSDGIRFIRRAYQAARITL